MNNRTDPVYSNITDKYLIPLILLMQINKIVNGTEYLQWYENVDQIINITNTTEISKINKVYFATFAFVLYAY